MSRADPIEDRFARARGAAGRWQGYTLSERVSCVRRWWREVAGRREDLLSVLHEETGKTRAEMEIGELAAAEMVVRYYTTGAHRILKDQAAWRPWIFFNKRTYVRYVPRGVVGIIAPWNVPFLISAGDSVPALLAGNAVVLKPSEWTPRTALFLERCFVAAGVFPEDLFQVIEGGPETGSRVVEASDMVVFTGSVAAGRKVAVAAAKDLKPAVLELGGKHSMIVLKDAELSRAARAAVWGAFANTGQLCVRVERVFVEEPVYEPFCARVVELTDKLRPGEDLGRIITRPQWETVRRHLEDARAEGARVHGGEVVDEPSRVMKPALVLDAKPGMVAVQEETFGPVLPILSVSRVEAALDLANSGPYGLSASLWTRDTLKAEEWSARLAVGLVSINDLSSHYVIASLPFGGFKSSGLGRRHSEEGMRMFCEPQSVLVHEWPSGQPELHWFPYTPFKTKLLSWLARHS